MKQEDKETYFDSKQIAESANYPFTLGQMRHYLMMRHRNGLEKAIRKIGKRLYFRKDLFNEWIENHQMSHQRYDNSNEEKK